MGVRNGVQNHSFLILWRELVLGACSTLLPRASHWDVGCPLCQLSYYLPFVDYPPFLPHFSTSLLVSSTFQINYFHLTHIYQGLIWGNLKLTHTCSLITASARKLPLMAQAEKNSFHNINFQSLGFVPFSLIFRALLPIPTSLQDCKLLKGIIYITSNVYVL